jgi:PadR family transcriptional regulator PadR
MGNLYRFAEPIVLVCLARLGTAYGYQLLTEAEQFAVTHAGLDSAAIYRALHRLQASRCVTSTWDTTGGGPQRRVYALTPRGVEHLKEWSQVLQSVSASIDTLLHESRRLSEAAPKLLAARSARRT